MIKNKKTIKKNPNPSAHKKMVKTQAVSSVKASETGCENYYDSTNSRLQIRTVLFFTISLLLFSFLIKGENFWTIIHNFLFGIFGVTFILWPILFMYISVCSALKREKFNLKRCFYYGTFSILFTSTFIFVFFTNNYKYENIFENLSFLYKLGIQNRSAGLASGILGIPLLNFLGIVGSKIVTSLAVFVFLILFFNTDINQTITSSVNFIKKLITHPTLKVGLKKIFKLPEPSPKITINTSEQKENIPQNNNNIQVNESSSSKGNINKNSTISKEDAQNQKANVSKDGYEFPPIYLLKSSMQEKNSENISKELKAKGETLIKILESFSVTAKIVNICKGPSVTRYELNPSCGTKISKITNLADDIALNLAALDIRIEAPIPGKSAIGIEIPNNVINLVRMQELINSREFINSKSKLTVVLGRDITGSVKIADLAKMPHLLIAGSTGAGKSVCINSFIISLLYKSSPNEVKLIMIDPKVVELGIYNGIPHLMVPVVTDPRKASNVLNWAVIEMLKRYKLFAEHNVRDLESFNSLTTDPSKNSNIKPLPEIVIIIDELADLMMASPKEVEDSICRLAQMARAAGMHLVIATQRPSVNVITGVIKANIPSRIALAVSSQIDSRTILDSTGAEKLLGKGDMLFSPIGSLKPIRVQGCFVTDREIQSVIDYIKSKNENNYNKDLLKEMDKVNDEEEDDYKEKPRNRRIFKK